MKKLFFLFLAYCSFVQGVEIPLGELADGEMKKYYLRGGIPIGVFKKSDEEKKNYIESIAKKYLPLTEFSHSFGNQLASSIYNQQVDERTDANNIAKLYGVFITYLPTTNCYFIQRPSSKYARFKDDCSGVEYDGNGRPINAKGGVYLATPTFTVRNDKLIVDITTVTTFPQIDFTPQRFVDRKFVKGIMRINNAFNWNRFELVLEEMELEPEVLKTSEFEMLVKHIMLNAGANDQLSIISKADKQGFNMDRQRFQLEQGIFSATELGIASLNPTTLAYLSNKPSVRNKCLSKDRMLLIKQVSESHGKYFENKEFEGKLYDYLDLNGNEYCWKRS